MSISRFVLFNGFLVLLIIYIIYRSRSKPKVTQLDFGPKRIDPGSASLLERELNCFFEFNGERLDAFETLGVPAGAPDDLLREGYRRELANARDVQWKARVQAAFEALKAQRGSL